MERLVKFGEAALIVLALVALAAVATFLVSSAATKVYTAEARLVVAAGLGLEQDADVLTAPRIAQTYGALALSTPVLTRVIKVLDLTEDPEALRQRVRVTADPATPFITIAATDEEPAHAQWIANAILDILVDRATLPASGTTPEKAILETVDRAGLPIEPSGPRVLFNTVLAAAVTFVLAATAIALILYVRGDRPPREASGG